MQFEDLQKTWQRQDHSIKTTLDMNLLLTEVRRNDAQFQATLLRRDAIEILGCAGMTIGFFAWGWMWQWWSLYLLSVCCLGVGVFFVMDRRIQRRRQPIAQPTVRGCIEESLHQLNHQIWLLKNILWWYLLPPIIGVAAVSAQTVTVIARNNPADAWVTGIVFTLTYTFTYGFVYWTNQRAVKKQFIPRRQELETLLASLE
jgi:hypothetical protein